MDIKRIDATSGDNIEIKRIEKTGKDFSFTLLSKIEEGQLKEKLNSLMGDITVQGKQLAEHMDLKYLKKYRALITEFINEIVAHSHKFSRENFLDRRGRHRVYGIIRLINKDLDDLAQELIKEEKEHIFILNKVDEIRGLLLDIIT
ncbi:MAG: hypothetical protein A2Y24_05305 [Clostridiales bacterium GWE2_32_10]|nr:MAG: hypothetical protein A2Y24_05305 [Clostridiales bacterium GWE2_32_10]HBY21596.1 DUF327 domain-containing protein [Clostridiales bacterium]